MRIAMSKFRNALERAYAAVCSNTNAICLEQKGHTLYVIGIGNGLKAMSQIDVADESEFVINVQAKTILGLSKQVQNEFIDLLYNEGKLSFKTEQIDASIVAFHGQSQLSIFKENIQSAVAIEGLQAKVSKSIHVIRAPSADVRRECLYVEIAQNNVRVTGIDDCRFTIRDDGVGKDAEYSFLAAGKDLTKACALLGSSLQVQIPEKKCFIYLVDEEKNVMVVPCVGGTYYNMDAFLRSFDAKLHVHLKKQELINALALTGLMDRGEKHRVVLTVLSRSEIMVSCVGTNGNADVRVSAVVSTDTPAIINDFRIAFNLGYLKEAVSSFEEQDVVLSLMSPLSFGYFHNQEETTREYILPIRLTQ